MQPDCPDCRVDMASVSLGMESPGSLAHAKHPFVTVEGSREGLLGTLGLSPKQLVEPLLCPECGRVRLYADVDG